MEINEKKIPICRRCGRKLKTPEAVERGMGRTCWEKSRTSLDRQPLFITERRVPHDDTLSETDTRVPKQKSGL